MKIKHLAIGCFPMILIMGGLLLVVGAAGGGNNSTLSVSGGAEVSEGCPLSSGKYDAELVDSVLANAGAFAGQRKAFEAVGKKYNIDPILIMAISIHETGWGKSQAVMEHNNPSGQMRGSTIIHFNTLEEGLDMTGQTLNNLWNERGLNTIEKLGSAYAPIGAANDPTGLNTHWVPTVKQFIEQLGGLSGGCDGASEDNKTNESLAQGKQGFAVPVKNYQITSGFGYRDFQGGEFHRGLDFGATEGEPIFASKAGEVITSSFHYSWGNHIVIQHEDGMVSLYAHQSKLVAQVGQHVKQGQLIGYVGNTGNSFGAHLHLEICQDASLIQAKLLDPQPILFGK
jgi:hypothetical protein